MFWVPTGQQKKVLIFCGTGIKSRWVCMWWTATREKCINCLNVWGLSKYLRVLLAKRPDICLPTFLAWYPIWLDYQNYISSQCTWPQKLGSGGQNRALGPDLHLRSKLSVFGVWDIMRPGAHMVGLTKKSYFRHQLAIKLGWPEAKEIFKFQKIC